MYFTPFPPHQAPCLFSMSQALACTGEMILMPPPVFSSSSQVQLHWFVLLHMPAPCPSTGEMVLMPPPVFSSSSQVQLHWFVLLHMPTPCPRPHPRIWMRHASSARSSPCNGCTSAIRLLVAVGRRVFVPSTTHTVLPSTTMPGVSRPCRLSTTRLAAALVRRVGDV